MTFRAFHPVMLRFEGGAILPLIPLPGPFPAVERALYACQRLHFPLSCSRPI